MNEFKETFYKEYENKYFSPGRINILGEHTDYNGGFCLPMSIDKGTYAWVSKNDEKKFNVFSENFSKEGIYNIKINNNEKNSYDKSNGWSNIFLGMIFVLKKYFKNIDFGLNIYFKSDIPIGSGLSSSASISMLIGYIMNDYYNLNLSTLDLVYLTQKMENEFLNAKTGILDQYAIGYGKKDAAMLIDTSAPSHKYFESDFKDYVFLIVNTNIKRELVDSKYNERVSECQKGLKMLQENGFSINNLCEISIDKINQVEKIIKDKIIFKRVKHCIYEQQRTTDASKSLTDIEKLGKLLNEGHESLRYDYEVTGKYLDFIHDFSKNLDYVAGARMTGAGFGGSAIVLIKKDFIEEFKENFSQEYYEKFNIKPFYIIARSAKGTHKC